MGFHIKNEKEKEVGNQGNFSRYAVQFYVTNTTGEAKMLLRKQGFTVFNDPSPDLVRFDVLNATGARLTSKRLTLQAPACNVMAVVEDKDCNSNKTVQNKRLANIGYWIRPGETIHADVIVIVPLNEQPRVQATLLMGSNAITGSASFDQGMPAASQPNAPNDFIPSDFVHLQNDWKRGYLNIEKGPLDCGPADMGWWSSQWQLVPVQGTNNYLIKNRWKEYCISTDHAGTMLSDNYNAGASMWTLEPVDNNNRYRIRNASTGFYLCIAGGRISTVFNSDDPGAIWIIAP